jgi:hypothetical protein
MDKEIVLNPDLSGLTSGEISRQIKPDSLLRIPQPIERTVLAVSFLIP